MHDYVHVKHQETIIVKIYKRHSLFQIKMFAIMNYIEYAFRKKKKKKKKKQAKKKNKFFKKKKIKKKKKKKIKQKKKKKKKKKLTGYTRNKTNWLYKKSKNTPGKHQRNVI